MNAEFHFRRLCLLAALCLLVCTLGACSGAAQDRQSVPTEPPEESFSYSFRDSSGSEVMLTKRPQRVAVLFSSFADIWTTAGGEIAVTVGESVARGFAPEDAVLVDPSAGHSSIDMETLVAAEPELVIGTADYPCQVQAVEFCREAGIPAAVFRVEAFEDYLGLLRIFCDITGAEERYETYGLAVQARIDELLEKTDAQDAQGRADYLLIRSGSSARSAKAKTTEDNFACAMLAELGAENIADTDSGLTGELSLELIVEADPDFLFITTMGDETASREYVESLLASEGWRELSCVKAGSYRFLPKELFHFKPNSRWAEAYEYLAAVLYPES